MNLVIDTHIFLWLLFDAQKIDKRKLQALENPQNNLFITSISFWEISIKQNLSKLKLFNYTPEDLPKLAKKMDIEILNVDEEIMATSYKLPKLPNHKDPFVRLIVWQCINGGFTLVSHDGKLCEYDDLRLL